MKFPSDYIGFLSALKSAFVLVLYGLDQSPIVAIVSPLYRLEMAQMGSFLNMAITILVPVRGLFDIIKGQNSTYKEFRFRHNGANLVIFEHKLG